eukprot:555449_1
MSVSILVDYIHNDHTPIQIKCAKNVEFGTFNQLIANQLKLFDVYGFKIGHIAHNEQIHLVNETNCSLILAGVSYLSAQQMIETVIDVCNKSTNVNDCKQIYISWFKEHNISGNVFVNFKHKDFSESIIKYANNNTKLRESSVELFKQLCIYDYATIFDTQSIINVVVGCDPEIPIIKDVYCDIKDEFNIKIQSQLINTFVFDIETENKQDSIILDSNKHTTKDLNTKISGKPNIKYRFRVKAINPFGESNWSKWSQYVDTFTKYDTMIKLGVDIYGVINSMKKDGVDITKITAFEKKHNVYEENIDRQTEIELKTKKYALTGNNITMRRLHWKRLNPETLKGSIWEHLDETKIDYDVNDFESHFKAQTRKVEFDEKKNPNQGKGICDLIKREFVSKERAHFVLIGLRSLKLTNDEIRSAVLNMDEVIVTHDVLAKLLEMRPTTEEQIDAKKQIIQEGTGNIEDYGDVEQFFYVLSEFNNLEQRLKLWLFVKEFDDIYDSIKAQYQMIASMCDRIKNSLDLKLLLSIILSFGNHMNSGTRKGQAHGFYITILTQMTSIKSIIINDNRSLLMYIYEFCDEKYPNALNVLNELLEPLRAVTSIELKMLKQSHQQIQHNMLKIFNLLTANHTENYISNINDRFIFFLNQFYQDTSLKMRNLNAMIKNVAGKERSVMEEFCYGTEKKPETVESFFKIWLQFLEDLNTSEQQLIKMKHQKRIVNRRTDRDKKWTKSMVWEQLTTEEIQVDEDELLEITTQIPNINKQFSSSRLLNSITKMKSQSEIIATDNKARADIVSVMIDYIYNDDLPVKVEFDICIEFHAFKQLIIDCLQLNYGDEIKIGHYGQDKKMRLITEKNFGKLLPVIGGTSLAMNICTTLFVGYKPVLPTIEHINHANDKLIINLKSKQLNTFCFEIKSDDAQYAIPSQRNTTKTLNMEITGVHPNAKYHIRIKAINLFGETNWSGWHSQKHDEEKITFSETSITGKQTLKTRDKNINDLPLHCFSVQDICQKLQQWLFNDVKHKKYLLQTQKIFKQHQLNGQKMFYLSAHDVKCIVKGEMLQFVTVETLNMIFDYFSKWKNLHHDSITSIPAEQIAEILYNHPVDRLVRRINDEHIDGEMMVEILEKGDDEIFSLTTGWDNEDIEQVKLLLLKCSSMTKKQFRHHFYRTLVLNNKSISHTIISKIREMFDKIDTEKIHYQIKNNRNSTEMQICCDKISNMVDEIVKNKDNHDDLIKLTYDAVAKCFIPDNHLLLDTHDWSCTNCGNYNFRQWINGKMNDNLSICSLCGISQVDSIILKIRNHDTFVMVNIDDNDSSCHEKDQKTNDDIDILLQEIINTQNIDLMCLNRNDNKQCPSILRLCKQLIIYKRGLQSISNKSNKTTNINKTIEVDVNTFVDNETYRDIFISTAKSIQKITDHHMKLLMEMLQSDIVYLNDVKEFVSIGRKKFAVEIKKATKMSTSAAARLYSKIKTALKQAAQRKQFGKFLSDLDLNNIDHDYHHILKIHITDGNKNSIKNVFRMFNTAIHYEDSDSIENCVSLKRQQHRVRDRKSEYQFDEEKETKNKNTNNAEDKNIWTLKQ